MPDRDMSNGKRIEGQLEGESLRQRLERRLGGLQTDRSSWENHWRELATHFKPRRGRWTLGEQDRGGNKHQAIIDSTPTIAARTLASGMMAGLTSPARPWFRLASPDPELNEFGAVKQYLYVVESRMREVFSKSNLYNVLPTIYGELGTFGTTAASVLEDDRDVLRLYPHTIGTYYLATSDRNQVDTIYRCFQLTVRQLAQRFGLDKLSLRTREMYKRGEFEQKIDVVHAVEANDEVDVFRADWRGMAYRSVYFERGGKHVGRMQPPFGENELLRVSGFREFPVLAPRWDVLDENIYGDSPAMDCLGDAKAVQIQQRRKAQAIDKMVDPPMVASSSLRNQHATLLPGGITYVDSPNAGDGFRPAYQVMPHIEHLVADIRETEERINRAMFADLFMMLMMSDRRQITAREVEERHEEKLLMLGPVLERLNDELLDPLIDRTFAIMNRKGMLPMPPQELQGAELRVEYISILHQAQKMVATAGMERFTAFVGALAEGKPDVLDKLDADQAVDEYAESMGVPPKLVVPDDAVMMIRQQRAEQQRMQQMAMAAQAAQPAAKAAKDLSETELTGNNALAAALGMGQ
jgi:hypothetical protein